MLSHTLTQTLVRWIVDLNFGMDVAAPTLTREFRIEESPLTMPDVSLMIQSGYVPRKEWIERHFRVELEEKKEGEEEGEATTYDPQKDGDLFGSIFGGEGNEQQAEANVDKAAAETEMPEGAAPEEGVGEPSEEEELGAILDSVPDDLSGEGEMEEMSLEELLGPDEEEEEPEKPFGDEEITEDEAVEMAKK